MLKSRRFLWLGEAEKATGIAALAISKVCFSHNRSYYATDPNSAKGRNNLLESRRCFRCKIIIMELTNSGLPILEQVLPILIIVLGLVLLVVAVWGITIFLRQNAHHDPNADEKAGPK